MQVDPNYATQLTEAINAAGARQQTLTTELSSGLRVATLSDDPAAAAQNVVLARSISSVDSFVQTSTREQSRMQATDHALGEVATEVTSAISLAVRAGSGTLSASNLSAIAAQVAGIRDSVIALGNTSYAGEYVFSGSQSGTRPFTLDTSTNPATANYSGDSVTQRIETPDGEKIPANLAGAAVFQSPAGDLLGTLNKLVGDLTAAAAGTGTAAGMEADSGALSTALGVVNSQRAVMDSALSRLTSVTTYASTQETVYKAQQSALLSADPATVATDLKSAEVQQQALYAVAAALDGARDLFSYLK